MSNGARYKSDGIGDHFLNDCQNRFYYDHIVVKISMKLDERIQRIFASETSYIRSLCEQIRYLSVNLSLH